MNIAIVKYNAGNIYSVVNALRRIGVEPVVTDDAEEICRADKVIFPGQGEAKTAMEYLRERRLDALIAALTQPVLGVCVGQQLLCRHSEEGDTDCIGIFPMDVKRFVPTLHEEKIPQMGWNSLTELKSPLFNGVRENDYVYFVHSYYVPLHNDYTIATSDFTLPYSAAIHKDNFYATQFHPEKSGSVGSLILKNFIDM